MKRYIFALIFLCVPGLVLASSVVRTGESLSIAQDQAVEGDYYGAGNYIDVSGAVAGDVLLAGGEVSVTGTVSDDTLILGGTVNLSGEAGDDVRVFGGSVVVSGIITGDLVVIANSLKIQSSAEIGGDVVFFSLLGGTADISGQVGGNIIGNSNSLRVDGSVAGGLDVKTFSLTLGERAEIVGDVRYQSNTDLVRAQDASVQGVVTRSEGAAEITINWRSLVIMLLIGMFGTLVVYLLLPSFVANVTSFIDERPLRSFLIGFAVLFFLPVAALVLLISTLGSLLGVLLLFGYGVLIILSLMMIGITTGSYIASLFRSKVTNSVGFVVAGVAVIQLALFIPIVGFGLVLAILLLTLGSVTERLYRLMRAG